MDDHRKVHRIIHSASAAALVVGAGLAQLPGSDAPVLTGIQLTMITALARHHGVDMADGAAEALLVTLAAPAVGRTVASFLVGWIPAIGNGVNALTAATLTESLGWGAHAYFQGGVSAALSGKLARPWRAGP